jgi:hypothetical protein
MRSFKGGDFFFVEAAATSSIGAAERQLLCGDVIEVANSTQRRGYSTEGKLERRQRVLALSD